MAGIFLAGNMKAQRTSNCSQWRKGSFLIKRSRKGNYLIDIAIGLIASSGKNLLHLRHIYYIVHWFRITIEHCTVLVFF